LRRLFDRWRLTLLGCPSLGVVAYIATGRISYTVLVVLNSAFAIGLCDTFVTSFLGAFVFLVLSGLLAIS
jgi:hypothetical protein